MSPKRSTSSRPAPSVGEASTVQSAAPQLRRWTPPEVVVVGGPADDLGAVDLSGVEVLAVAVSPRPDAGDSGEFGDSAGTAGTAVVAGNGAAAAALRYGVDVVGTADVEKVTGRPAATRLPVQAPAGLPRRLVVVGTGDGGTTDLRRAGAALARTTAAADVATTVLDGVDAAGARAFVEGFLLAAYSPPVSGRRGAEEPAARRILLLGDVAATGVDQARVVAGASVLARDLAATPSNLKDPAWMVEQATAAAAQHGLAVEVRGVEELRAQGFGGLLAVGAGSTSPPALVQVGWTPTSTSVAVPHVVLVGKGITFDTGGLALKPRESMVAMKTDMTGSAVVLAVVAAAAQLQLPVRVTGLLALAENAFGGSAYRPGDVVRHYGGRTTEVNNTDAEGRMVLGDALAYADAELDPDVVVDIATLTGAVGVALGKRHAALLASDDELAGQLLSAGEGSGERLWRLPLVADYADLLTSPIADATQVAGKPGAGAGTILAALFLQPFTGGRRWAHLDIAGTGRADSAEHEVNRGATGFGARVLLTWLESLGRTPGV